VLNCKWATTRLHQNPTEAFDALLKSTESDDNVQWILRSAEQMLLERGFLSDEDSRLLKENVRKYVKVAGRRHLKKLRELEDIIDG
jgi:hypothetical protein